MRDLEQSSPHSKRFEGDVHRKLQSAGFHNNSEVKAPWSCSERLCGSQEATFLPVAKPSCKAQVCKWRQGLDWGRLGQSALERWLTFLTAANHQHCWFLSFFWSGYLPFSTQPHFCWNRSVRFALFGLEHYPKPFPSWQFDGLVAIFSTNCLITSFKCYKWSIIHRYQHFKYFIKLNQTQAVK